MLNEDPEKTPEELAAEEISIRIEALGENIERIGAETDRGRRLTARRMILELGLEAFRDSKGDSNE